MIHKEASNVRKYIGKLLFSLVAAAALAVPVASADDQVKIGLLFDVTGPVANFVPPMLDAAKLVVDQVNAQGGILGGKQLAVTVADTQGAPQTAVDAANKLVNAEHVPIVVGPLLSGTVLASAQSVIIPAGVVQISPSATTPALTKLKDHDWVFRVVPSDAYQGPVLARLLMDKGLKRVALTYANDDYAVGIAGTFRAAYKKLGGVITTDLQHDEKKKTFRTELAALAKNKPQALVLIAFAGASGVTIVKESLEGGFFTQFVGTDSLRDKVLIEQVGEQNLKGIFFTSPSSPPGTPSMDAFEKAYSAAFQTTKDKLFIQQVYDATFLAALAIQKAGSTDRKKIHTALREISGPGGEVVGPGDWKKAVDLMAAGKKIDYQGASGDCNFDKNGDVAGVIGHFIIENGSFKQVGIVTP
jgi:branched-chain amino acid transport system substrate-binding protein